MLLKLCAYCGLLITRCAPTNWGWSMVKYLVANEIGCSVKLLRAYLRGVIAVIDRCQGGHLCWNLSSPVAGGTPKSFQSYQTCSRGSWLPARLIRASIFAVFLLTASSPQHRVQYFRAIAIGLHLYFLFHSWLIINLMTNGGHMFGTLRVMTWILIVYLIQIQLLLVIHVDIFDGAIPTLDHPWLLRYRQAAGWMVELVRKVDIFFAKHEWLCLRLLCNLRLINHGLIRSLLLNLQLFRSSPASRYKSIWISRISNSMLLVNLLRRLHGLLHGLLRKRLPWAWGANCVILDGPHITINFASGGGSWCPSHVHWDVLLSVIVVTRVYLVSARHQRTTQWILRFKILRLRFGAVRALQNKTAIVISFVDASLSTSTSASLICVTKLHWDEVISQNLAQLLLITLPELLLWAWLLRTLAPWTNTSSFRTVMYLLLKCSTGTYNYYLALLLCSMVSTRWEIDRRWHCCGRATSCPLLTCRLRAGSHWCLAMLGQLLHLTVCMSLLLVSMGSSRCTSWRGISRHHGCTCYRPLIWKQNQLSTWLCQVDWRAISCCSNCLAGRRLRREVVLKWALHFYLQLLLGTCEATAVLVRSHGLLLLILMRDSVTYLCIKRSLLVDVYELLALPVIIYHWLSGSLVFRYKFLSIEWVWLRGRSRVMLPISGILSYLQLCTGSLSRVLLAKKITWPRDPCTTLFVLAMSWSLGISILLCSAIAHFDLATPHILAMGRDEGSAGGGRANMGAECLGEDSCAVFCP